MPMLRALKFWQQVAMLSVVLGFPNAADDTIAADCGSASGRIGVAGGDAADVAPSIAHAADAVPGKSGKATPSPMAGKASKFFQSA